MTGEKSTRHQQQSTGYESPPRTPLKILEALRATRIGRPATTNKHISTRPPNRIRLRVYTKLAEKDALRHPVQAKEFVTGEGFRYLGRSYRLLLVDEQDVPLKLEAGRFKLLRGEVGKGREHFVAWYKAHALPWFRRRVKLYAPRIGAEPTRVDVRDLGFRWGSCGRAGGVNFNWQTIVLPANVVDYVVVHELVHLREGNHTPEFWTRVERVLPDFQQRKDWLAANGAGFVGV